MKTYEVKYTKGHLVDIKTGKHIKLKPGGRYTIVGDDDQFEEEDILSGTLKFLSASEQVSLLHSKYPLHRLELIAKKGTAYIYRVGISKRTKEDANQEFFFKAEIVEDLYLRSKDGEKWSLCDCYCETSECLSGGLKMVESVDGKSLTSLFSNLIACYFPRQRAGSCNAFTTFFEIDDNEYALENYRSKRLRSVDDCRTELERKAKLL